MEWRVSQSPWGKHSGRTVDPSTPYRERPAVTLWIAVPEDQRKQATTALIDTGVTIHTTRTGPEPGVEEHSPRRDPGEVFLLVSFGLTFLGLGGWGLWESGWWVIPAVLSVLAGLVCISASLGRPKPKTSASGEVSEPA